MKLFLGTCGKTMLGPPACRPGFRLTEKHRQLIPQPAAYSFLHANQLCFTYLKILLYSSKTNPFNSALMLRQLGKNLSM
jgi:hypothetical protein